MPGLHLGRRVSKKGAGWSQITWSGVSYWVFTNPLTGLRSRHGIRDGYQVVDEESQIGGFDLAEGVGWDNVESVFISWTPLVRNADLVQINSIDSIDTLGTVYYRASNVGTDGYEFFNKLKSERIFQTDTLTQIHFNVYALVAGGNNITKVLFRIWRYNGATYDMIHSVNITASLVVGDNVLTLPTPLAVVEGDFQSITIKESQAANMIFAYASTHTGKNAYELQANGTSTPWAWDASAVTNPLMHIHCRSQAPLAVGIGDSIMGGHPLHHGMIDEFAPATDITKSWFYKLNALNPLFVYQNMGIANETMALIAARFNRDVILKKPALCVINGGFNDWGSRTKAAWLADYVTCLDLCVANDIRIVVWSINCLASVSIFCNCNIGSRAVTIVRA